MQLDEALGPLVDRPLLELEAEALGDEVGTSADGDPHGGAIPGQFQVLGHGMAKQKKPNRPAGCR